MEQKTRVFCQIDVQEFRLWLEKNRGRIRRFQGWAKLVLIALERYSVVLKRLTFNLR